MLAGREFVTYLQNAIDTIKLELGSADLTKPIEDNLKNSLQFYIDNQRTLLGIELFSITQDIFTATLGYRYFVPTRLEELGLKPEDVRLEAGAFEKHRNDLQNAGFFFANISKSGTPPMLAIVFADTASAKTRGYLPTAVGYVSLKPFYSGSTRTFGRQIILDGTGTVVFHSDAKEMYANIDRSKDSLFTEGRAATTTSGAKEYVDAEGRRMLSSYYKPGFNLVVLSQVEYEQAMKATYALTEKFVMLAVAALGFMILAGLLFSKRITRPIQRLFAATGQIAVGNFDVTLPVTSHDEIGVLTKAFMIMSKRMSGLIKQMVDQVRIDQELAIAKTVQQSLFPEIHIKNENLLIASHYQSATECGGDWWGYFKNGKKHFIAIADATGHGLPSALMTAAARSCFSVIETLVTSTEFSPDPAEMLSITNRVVYDSAQGKIMMTFLIAVLDFERKTITFASAGHNPPWMFSPQPNGGFKMTSLVVKSGQRLGESYDNPGYVSSQLPVNVGDTIVFYTDGLIEGKNSSGNQYGKKQARKILEGAMNDEPSHIVEKVMRDFLEHNEGKALDDDVTLAVTRIHGG